MKRINPETGEIFLPHRFRDGNFRVADPAKGNVKHHARNQIAVATAAEVKEMLKDGFLLRMRGADSGRINLISATQIDM